MHERDNTAGKFRNLSRIATLIQDSRGLEDVLTLLTEEVCLNSSWNFASIQVLDMEVGKTISVIRYDPFKTARSDVPFAWDAADSPVSTVVKTGRPVVIRDVAEQDRYIGFRDDARNRGYHTVAVLPLKFPDNNGRPLVFTVISHARFEPDDIELAYLQCVADLADIAVRGMLKLAEEAAAAEKAHSTLRNLTAALASSLSKGMTDELLLAMGTLIPRPWFALDLTTGSIICDQTGVPPAILSLAQKEVFTLMRVARQAPSKREGSDITLGDGALGIRLRVRPLAIDGQNVGALFLLHAETLAPQEWLSIEAAHMALSTVILRNYQGFRSRNMIERRSLQNLFSGTSRQEEMQAELKMLGVQPSEPRRLLMLQTGTEALPGDMHSFILRKAEAAFGMTLSLLDGSRLTLLLRDQPELNEERARNAFLRAVQPAWHHLLSLTLSEPLHQLTQYADAYANCCRVLEVAAGLQAAGWITGHKIGFFPQLMASLPKNVSEAFLERTIHPLLEGGSEKGKVTLQTLGTYLSTGRRLQETADLMGIHVSTLRYRLQRLQERHGIDLEDGETCFDLEMALRLHSLRNSYQSDKN